jgi:hypothetical protein
VKDHVLLPYADELDSVDFQFRSILQPDRLRAIVSLIPDEWLIDDSIPGTPQEKREVYSSFLETRLINSEIFVKEAKHAREALI